MEELSYFENFKITHIKREGYEEADTLSKWALSLNDEAIQVKHSNEEKNINYNPNDEGM